MPQITCSVLLIQPKTTAVPQALYSVRQLRQSLAWLVAAVMLAGALSTVSPTWALEDDNEKTGFNSNNVFQSSSGDNINVLNGNLTFQIPIYSVPVAPGLAMSVSLSYNSKIWDLTDHDNTSGEPIKVRLAARSEVGLGFRIRPGRIFSREIGTPQTPVKAWYYEDEAGALHFLTNTDHYETGPFVTTDSSFLKTQIIRFSDDSIKQWELWTPDGIKSTFAYHVLADYPDSPVNAGATSSNKGWYLTKRETADGLHWVTYAYGGDVTGDKFCLTSMQDDRGRTVDLVAVNSINTFEEGIETASYVTGGYIDKIKYSTFNGSTSTQGPLQVCTLNYSVDNLILPPPPGTCNGGSESGQNCTQNADCGQSGTCIPGSAYTISPAAQKVLLLRAISCPPVIYSFDYNSDGTNRGELQTRTMPTGAQVKYQYGTYSTKSSTRKPRVDDCDPGSCHYGSGVQRMDTRAVTKKTVAASGYPDAEWRYARTLEDGDGGGVQCANIIERQVGKVVVLDPFGNATVNRFAVSADEVLVEVNGTLIKEETYEGDPRSSSQNARLIRTIERHYRFDGDGNTSDSACTGVTDVATPVCLNESARNVRPDRETTVYNDGVPNAVAKKNESTCWDQRGHWRERREYSFDGHYDGTFDGPSYRTIFTNYPYLENSDPNGYLGKWILNTYGFVATRAASGANHRYTAFQFDGLGRLTSSRAYLHPLGSSPSTNARDVLVTYTYYPTGSTPPSTPGFLASKTTSFGDASSPVVENYQYQSGRLSRRWLSGMAWNSLRRDIDFGTGLVIREYDTSNVETNFSWDAFRRLSQIIPGNDEVETSITYPSLVDTVVQRVKVSGSDYTQEHYYYDTLGRLTKTSRRQPDGTTSCQCQSMDAGNKILTRSSWSSDTSAICPANCAGIPVTEYSYIGSSGLNDPLGRIRREREPDYTSDGTTKETLTSYAGPVKTVTVRGIRSWVSSTGGPPIVVEETGFTPPNVSVWRDAVTQYEDDAFGRLVRVTPPSEGAEATYAYDVIDDLTGVQLIHNGIVQTRGFASDSLGRRTSSTTPESGTTTTLEFDPRGNPLLVQDAKGAVLEYKLRSTFDKANRLTLLERVASDASPGVPNEVLVAWTMSSFGSGNPPALSKWNEHTDGQSQCGTVHSFSSPMAWYFGDESECRYFAGRKAGRLESNIIGNIDKLSTLSFMYWRETRSTGSSGTRMDTLNVYVSTDNFATKAKVFSLDSNDKSGSDWRSSGPISLADFAGQSIKIRVEFDPSAAAPDAGPARGVLLDDIAVKSPSTLTLVENIFDNTGPIVGRGSSLGKLVTSRSYVEEPAMRDGVWGSRLVSERNFYYDGLNGRLSREDISLDPEGDGSFDNFTSGTIWDLYGMEGTLTYPAPVGAASGYINTYQNSYLNGALSSLQGAGSCFVQSVAYDAFQLPGITTFGNGTKAEVDRDFLARPVGMSVVKQNGQAILGLGNYHYDGAGNIFSIGSENYRYDLLNRVIHSSFPGTVSANYAYDPWGNMTISHSNDNCPPAGMEFVDRAYAASGSVPDNRIHDGGFSYDQNGSLLTDPAQGSGACSRPEYHYSWDAQGRMTHVSAPPGAEGYKDLLEELQYDASGVRTAKSRWDRGGEVSLYLRDSSGRLLSEYRKDPGAGLSLQKDYLYANGSMVAENVVCGPPPTLSLDNLSWSGGKFRFIKSAPGGSPLSTAGYVFDIQGSTAHTISLSQTTPDHFEIPEGEFPPSGISHVRIQTLAACGSTGYSNELSVSRGAGFSGGGGGEETICLANAAAVKLEGEETILLLVNDTCAEPGVTYDYYYRADSESEWIKLNEEPTQSSQYLLESVSEKSGEGEYQAKRLVNEIEVEESPIVSLVGSELGELTLGGLSLTPRYLHADHLGSTRLMTDTLGNVLSSHDYYAFGSERLNTGPKDGTNSVLFCGSEKDRETNLDYMEARYCAGSMGRFLSVDPEERSIDSSNPQSWNRYSYALNNPIIFVDPDGRETRQAEETASKGDPNNAVGLDNVVDPSECSSGSGFNSMTLVAMAQHGQLGDFITDTSLAGVDTLATATNNASTVVAAGALLSTPFTGPAGLTVATVSNRVGAVAATVHAAISREPDAIAYAFMSVGSTKVMAVVAKEMRVGLASAPVLERASVEFMKGAVSTSSAYSAASVANRYSASNRSPLGTRIPQE